MEAIDLLLNRRSSVVKNMIPPGPTDEELESILTAGIRVPDHGKIFPWRIQIPTPEGRRRLGEIGESLCVADHSDLDEDHRAIERRRFSRGPLLLVVSSRTEDHPKVPLSEQILSGGAVCQNILNAAHSLGYVAQWLTEWPAYRDEVKAELEIPLDQDIIGFIYIGSVENPPSERRRAELADVVGHWDPTTGNTPYGDGVGQESSP